MPLPRPLGSARMPSHRTRLPMPPVAPARERTGVSTSEPTEHQDRPMARRRLFRGAGAAPAGVASAGVAATVIATPAHAAPGDPVVQGQSNNAGTSETALVTNNAGQAALELANSSSVAGPGGLIETGPALRL